MNVLRHTWSQQAPRTRPYSWLATAPGELFDADTACALAQSFPSDAFLRKDASARQGEKSYRNFSRPLVTAGRVIDDRLPPLWQALLADLLSQDYRDRMVNLLGQAQMAFTLEVRLVRHANGDWIGPHTDRADKVFSHILYFNSDWQEGWGGRLEILAGNDPKAVFASITPRLGASALLLRCDHSWHQVTPVAIDGAPARMSLLVHGLRLAYASDA